MTQRTFISRYRAFPFFLLSLVLIISPSAPDAGTHMKSRGSDLAPHQEITHHGIPMAGHSPDYSIRLEHSGDFFLPDVGPQTARMFLHPIRERSTHHSISHWNSTREVESSGAAGNAIFLSLKGKPGQTSHMESAAWGSSFLLLGSGMIVIGSIMRKRLKKQF